MTASLLMAALAAAALLAPQHGQQRVAANGHAEKKSAHRQSERWNPSASPSPPQDTTAIPAPLQLLLAAKAKAAAAKAEADAARAQARARAASSPATPQGATVIPPGGSGAGGSQVSKVKGIDTAWFGKLVPGGPFGPGQLEIIPGSSGGTALERQPALVGDPTPSTPPPTANPSSSSASSASSLHERANRTSVEPSPTDPEPDARFDGAGEPATRPSATPMTLDTAKKDRAGRDPRGGPDRGFPEGRPAADRGPPAALLETGGRALSAVVEEDRARAAELSASEEEAEEADKKAADDAAKMKAEVAAAKKKAEVAAAKRKATDEARQAAKKQSPSFTDEDPLAMGYSPAHDPQFQAAMTKLVGFTTNVTALVEGPGRVYAQPPFDWTNFSQASDGGLGSVGNTPIAAFPLGQDVTSWTDVSAGDLGFTGNLTTGIAGQSAVHMGSGTSGGLAAFLANDGSSGDINHLFGLPTNFASFLEKKKKNTSSFLEIGAADNGTGNASTNASLLEVAAFAQSAEESRMAARATAESRAKRAGALLAQSWKKLMGLARSNAPRQTTEPFSFLDEIVAQDRNALEADGNRLLSSATELIKKSVTDANFSAAEIPAEVFSIPADFINSRIRKAKLIDLDPDESFDDGTVGMIMRVQERVPREYWCNFTHFAEEIMAGYPVPQKFRDACTNATSTTPAPSLLQSLEKEVEESW